MNRLVDLNKTFNISGYSYYYSQKFDINKVFTQDHQCLFVNIIVLSKKYKVTVKEGERSIFQKYIMDQCVRYLDLIMIQM